MSYTLNHTGRMLHSDIHDTAESGRQRVYSWGGAGQPVTWDTRAEAAAFVANHRVMCGDAEITELEPRLTMRQTIEEVVRDHNARVQRFLDDYCGP